MKTSYTSLTREIEFLEARQRLIATEGPTLRISHRFQIMGLPCGPGEEVVQAALLTEQGEYVLPLSTALLQILDYLAKHRFGLSAQQITVGMQTDRFYKEHGSNADSGRATLRRFSRSSIKQYVRKIRSAIDHVAREARLEITGMQVLATESTESNQARYRLRATCQWIHLAPIPYKE